VLSPSTTATMQGFSVLRQSLSRLPVGTIDAIAVHTYTHRAWPEQAIPAEMTALRGALPPAYAGIPIWSTEGGWGFNKDRTPTSRGSSDASDQRAFVARYDLMMLIQGFARSYWYAYQNTQWGTLFDGTGLTPAGIATRTLDAWLAGATLTGCATANGNLWTCDLIDATGAKSQIVWTTKRAAWHPAGNFATVETLEGRSSAAPMYLRAGYEPVLLTGERSLPARPTGRAFAAPLIRDRMVRRLGKVRWRRGERKIHRNHRARHRSEAAKSKHHRRQR
jgi:hypothetical protein